MEYNIYYQVDEILKRRSKTLSSSYRLMKIGIEEKDKYKIYVSLLDVLEITVNLRLEIERVENIKEHNYFNVIKRLTLELWDMEVIPDMSYEDYTEEHFNIFESRLHKVGQFLEQLLKLNEMYREEYTR